MEKVLVFTCGLGVLPPLWFPNKPVIEFLHSAAKSPYNQRVIWSNLSPNIWGLLRMDDLRNQPVTPFWSGIKVWQYIRLPAWRMLFFLIYLFSLSFWFWCREPKLIWWTKWIYNQADNRHSPLSLITYSNLVLWCSALTLKIWAHLGHPSQRSCLLNAVTIMSLWNQLQADDSV